MWMNKLFKQICTGADWVLETVNAQITVCIWAADVVAQGPSKASLALEMAQEKFGTFSGIGKHLHADFLHSMVLELHPAMPAWDICSDPK
jgi:hypothetical protein